MKKKCTGSMLFAVPHREDPMLFREIRHEFPDFVKLFDGQAEENTMAFYWKRDTKTRIFVFRDSESEDEVAELMKVQVLVKKDAYSDDDEPEDRQLTAAEIQNFREYLDDVHTIMGKLYHK